MMVLPIKISIPWSILLVVVMLFPISSGVPHVLQLENEKLNKCSAEGHNNSWKVRNKSMLNSLKKKQDDYQ